jgi:cytidine deaminase
MSANPHEASYRKLIAAAKQAAELAYRPYSKFNVGAAVLTFDGRIYVGCNVENCGYTQTKHAEEVAVCNAIADGALKRAHDAGLTQFDFIKAVAVHAPKGDSPWPCCNCRQFLNEWGLKFDIIGEGKHGEILCKKLEELIPNAFAMELVLASIDGKEVPQNEQIATAPAPVVLTPAG